MLIFGSSINNILTPNKFAFRIQILGGLLVNIEIKRIAISLVTLSVKNKLLWSFKTKSWPQHIMNVRSLP